MVNNTSSSIIPSLNKPNGTIEAFLPLTREVLGSKFGVSHCDLSFYLVYLSHTKEIWGLYIQLRHWLAPSRIILLFYRGLSHSYLKVQFSSTRMEEDNPDIVGDGIDSVCDTYCMIIVFI